MIRAAGAAMSALLIGAVAFGLAAAAWPASRWVGNTADLASPHLLVRIAFANAVVIIGVYFAFAALAWGVEMRQWPNRGICPPSPPTLRVIESGAWFTSRIFMLWASAMDFVSRVDDRAAGKRTALAGHCQTGRDPRD